MMKLLIVLSICLGVLSSNITVAIIGTNDIHGAALPTTLERTYNN